MDKNISLEEYKDILENVKAAALEDMKTVGKCRSDDAEKSALSLFLLELKCRDPEDYEMERQERAQIFTDFASLLEGMRDWRDVPTSYKEQKFSEPVSDKLYWRVSRHTWFLNRMTVIYSVYFTLKEEIFSVEPDFEFTCYFEQHEEIVRQNMPVSPSLEYILQNRRQLMLAWNVELSLKPGDAVYVDVRPFRTPFYALYRERTDECARHCDIDPFLKNNGFRIVTHPFFFCDAEDKDESKRKHLWRCMAYPYFSEDFNLKGYNGCSGETPEKNIVFPHAPYERLTVVESDDKKVEQKDKR